jgi:chromosome segregation ATPase
MSKTDQEANPDQTLERRRNKTRSARDEAGKADSRVKALDAAINASSARTDQYKKDLKKAEQKVSELKKSLKTTAKQQDRLSADRVKASAAAVKAHSKARKIESKYDQSVLQEIVRREKLADLGQDNHSDSGPHLKPETPSLGTTTATQVAARTTADRS